MAAKRKNRAAVFAVRRGETADGRFHEVSWARDGDLNKAGKRGDQKRFREWGKAKKFAKQAGEILGVKPIID